MIDGVYSIFTEKEANGVTQLWLDTPIAVDPERIIDIFNDIQINNHKFFRIEGGKIRSMMFNVKVVCLEGKYVNSKDFKSNNGRAHKAARSRTRNLIPPCF